MSDFHLHSSLLAAALQRNGVKLMAIDFDQTMLDIHTHSKWEDGPALLARHVRPLFLQLVPAVLRKGIVLCICSFSSQRKLIQQTMREAFGPTLARQILIRCHDGSWSPTPIESAPRCWYGCSRRGKLDHILSVVTKIYMQSSVEVAPEQVVLVDDVKLNVMQARYDGIHAFLFDAADPANGDACEMSPIFTELMAAFRGKSCATAHFSSKDIECDPAVDKIRKESAREGAPRDGSPSAAQRQTKVKSDPHAAYAAYNKFDDLGIADQDRSTDLPHMSPSKPAATCSAAKEGAEISAKGAPQPRCLPKTCSIM